MISGHVNDDSRCCISQYYSLAYINDTDHDGAPDGPAIATTMTNASDIMSLPELSQITTLVTEINPALYSDVSDYDHTISPTDIDGDDSAQGPDDNIPVRVLRVKLIMITISLMVVRVIFVER